MGDNLSLLSCAEFSEALASAEPVPGGGGASAYAAALASALGLMVGNLTVGRKKYAPVEADVKAAMKKLETLRKELVSLVDGDAQSFMPLSRAYSLPRETPAQQAERARVMEAALRGACVVPTAVMRRCCEVIALQERLAEIGSALAISDVGVGAVLAKAALMGASLNIFINARAMADRAYADALTAETNAMLAEYCPVADDVFARVCRRIG